MDVKQLREKTEKELLVEKDSLVKELHELRFKKVIGVLENPARMGLIRKSIARINTILQEKKIAEIQAKI